MLITSCMAPEMNPSDDGHAARRLRAAIEELGVSRLNLLRLCWTVDLRGAGFARPAGLCSHNCWHVLKI